MNLKFAKEVGFLNYVFRRLLWRVRPGRATILHNGVIFPTPSVKFFASDVFVSRGNVDWNSEYILNKFLKDSGGGGDFLDVGSHIGYYSVLLSESACKVHAFEPDSRNHAFLQAALKPLRCAELIPCAVSDEDGTSSFSDSEESSISHLDKDGEGSPVKTVKIDTYVKEKSLKPSAIKIDIEGYDILALGGAVECAKIHRPIFLVEYNQEEGRPNSWVLLEKFIEETDYLVFLVHRKDSGVLGYSYNFETVPVPRLAELEYKMVFLVPRCKRGWFDHFAENSGSWKSPGLRRKAVKAFLAGQKFG